MTIFLAPYTAIADIDGSPLDAGFLFFGEYGKDPELFPIEVFWDADFTVPAAQPIRTRNGYPIRNGSPCKIYLKQADHSLVVKNKNLSAILVEMNNKGISSSLLVRPDGSTVETSLMEIDAALGTKASSEYVDNQVGLMAPQATTYTKTEVDSALSLKAPQSNTYTKAEVDTTFAAYVGGRKAYQTLALAQADQAALPTNTAIEVTNDGANNGTYQWDGTTLTKSAYDPLTQAKADATTKANAAEENANKFAINAALSATANIQKTDSTNLHEFPDANGDFPVYINEIGEVVAENFKTANGNLNDVAKSIFRQDLGEYTHVSCDSEGNIVLATKQNGTSISADLSLNYGISEMRANAVPSHNINELGISLDISATQSDTAYSFEVEVSPYQADGTEAQRMPAAIKIGPNKLYVAFTQFSVYNNDQQDGRLVARTVDYDLVNKTATVSGTIPIIGEKIGNNYRHPHFIRLKDRILLIFNGNTPDLLVYESLDNCASWQLKTQIPTTIAEPWALALDSVVRIEEGMYAGRIVAGLFNSPDLSKLCTVYSDDDGVTWKRGQTINNADYFPSYPNLNEISIACDAQNNLIFAIRNETTAAEARYIIFAKSIDGGHSFQFFTQSIKTPTVGVQIGMKQIAPNIFGGGVPKIIATHPTGNNRTQFILRVSYDGCKSWAYDYKPWAMTEMVGYGVLVPLSEKDFVLVVEKGPMLKEQSVAVKFLNLKEIM